jgi:drug/metabolite transporter (DMT)-like permease
MTSSERTGALTAAAATTMVGTAVAASSLLVHYPVMGGQALRYAASAIILVVAQRVAGGRPPRLTLREAGLLLALATSGLVAFNLCVIGAVGRADPAVVGLVVGCAPVLLGVAGPLLARRPPRVRMLAAAAVVVAGTGLAQGGGHASATGLALAAGALLGEAGFSLLAVPLLPRLGPVSLSAYACAIASAMLAVGAVALHGRAAVAIPTGAEAAALAWLAVATPAAFVAWYSGLDRLGVDRAGLFAGLIPVAALLSVAVVGTSTITPLKLSGSLLVGGGLVLGLVAQPPLRVRRAWGRRGTAPGSPTAAPRGPAPGSAAPAAVRMPPAGSPHASPPACSPAAGRPSGPRDPRTRSPAERPSPPTSPPARQAARSR